MSTAETSKREPPSKRKEEFNGQDRKPKPHEMGLQVPRCIHTEGSKKRVVRATADASRGSVSRVGKLGNCGKLGSDSHFHH